MSIKHDEHSKITTIGATDWRNNCIPFGIKDADRLRHIYAIGKTGVGKSTLLENMAISDILRGNGVCIVDPHGDIAEGILNYVPRERIDDVIYFNAGDVKYPIAYNPLQNVDKAGRHLVCTGLITTMKKIWVDSWGPRLEYILQFSILTLLHYPSATLLDIQPLLVDKDFRQHVLSNVSDKHILAFWCNEFDKYPHQLRVEAITPILNKTGLFITHSPIQNILAQTKTSFNIKDVLDTRKILICNLAKGIVGEETSSLLGSMLLSSIQLTAMQRASQEEEFRKPFYLYVDEMHSFMSLSFIDILAEARKYGLSIFLTHQYIEQVNEKMRNAIFGNVGTMIAFQTGNEDARYLQREFEPMFSAVDLINLPRYSMYIKLMIDGATSKPFSAISLPINQQAFNLKQEIINHSRRKYGRPIKSLENNGEKEMWQPKDVQGKLF